MKQTAMIKDLISVFTLFEHNLVKLDMETRNSFKNMIVTQYPKTGNNYAILVMDRTFSETTLLDMEFKSFYEYFKGQFSQKPGAGLNKCIIICEKVSVATKRVEHFELPIKIIPVQKFYEIRDEMLAIKNKSLDLDSFFE